MKKIIILSDTGKVRIDMISSFKELFPECEIQTITYQSKSIDKGDLPPKTDPDFKLEI